MDKLKYIKLENQDGSYTDSIPLSVDADSIEVNGVSLVTELANKATKAEVAAVASGSPAGVYSTVSALTTADPDHSKIYVVSQNGHWYYYNSNSWIDGGVYQSSENSDAVLAKVNILDFIEFEQGKIVMGTGSLGTDSTRIRTKDYIEGPYSILCPNGFKIVVLATYDKITHDCISSVAINTNFISVTENTDLYVTKFSIGKTNGSETLSINDWKSLYGKTYMKNIANDISYFTDNIQNNGLTASYNCIVRPNYYYHYDSTNVRINDVYVSGTFVSIVCPKVICNSLNKIMYKGSSNSYHQGIIFVDSNDIPISAIYGSYADAYTQISVPEGTAYCIIQGNNAYDFDFYLINPDNQIAGFDSKLKTIFDTIPDIDYKSILTNKKWVICGDSFSHGDFSGMSASDYKFTTGRYANYNKVYGYYIGNRTGMNIVMLAANGSTMTSIENRANCFSNDMYLNIPVDADYITFYYGINDINQSVPIGTIDSTDITTFYGAWNVVLSWLRENRPFAHVGIVVTNKSGYNTTVANFLTAIRDVAKKYGYPTLDLQADTNIPLLMNCDERPNLDSSIKTLVKSQQRVSANNGHPSPQTHEFMSFFIEEWLKTL